MNFIAFVNKKLLSFLAQLSLLLRQTLLFCKKIIKVLHEKILKAINLYRFQNCALEKTNSLNGHSNEAGVNR